MNAKTLEEIKIVRSRGGKTRYRRREVVLSCLLGCIHKNKGEFVSIFTKFIMKHGRLHLDTKKNKDWEFCSWFSWLCNFKLSLILGDKDLSWELTVLAPMKYGQCIADMGWIAYFEGCSEDLGCTCGVVPHPVLFTWHTTKRTFVSYQLTVWLAHTCKWVWCWLLLNALFEKNFWVNVFINFVCSFRL